MSPRNNSHEVLHAVSIGGAGLSTGPENLGGGGNIYIAYHYHCLSDEQMGSALPAAPTAART